MRQLFILLDLYDVTETAYPCMVMSTEAPPTSEAAQLWQKS